MADWPPCKAEDARATCLEHPHPLQIPMVEDTRSRTRFLEIVPSGRCSGDVPGTPRSLQIRQSGRRSGDVLAPLANSSKWKTLGQEHAPWRFFKAEDAWATCPEHPHSLQTLQSGRHSGDVPGTPASLQIPHGGRHSGKNTLLGNYSKWKTLGRRARNTRTHCKHFKVEDARAT